MHGSTSLFCLCLHFGKLKRLSHPSRRAGQKGAHALPVRCAQSCAGRLLEMQQQCFFIFPLSLFWGGSLGYQLSVWLRIHSSRQFSEPPIFKSMLLPKRALWLAGFPIV